MSQIDKLIQKFKDNPEKIKYVDLVKILKYLNFETISIKGSHVKYKKNQINIVIPVHNNECKSFYKKEVYKIIKNLL